MSVAIVTGASSGMGEQFVYLCNQYFPELTEVWMIARREEKLVDMASRCPFPTRVVVMDVTSGKDLRDFRKLLKEEKPEVALFVQSAGAGVMGKFTELPIGDQLRTMRLNQNALVRLSYEVLPYMKRGARMIHMASAAAFLPQPGFAVYAAAKSFVLSFSRALNAELSRRKITVTAVCPGPVQTEFFDHAEKYHDTLPIKKLFYVQPEDVVNGALNASLHRRSVYTHGVVFKGMQLVSKIVPTNVILFFEKMMMK